MEGTMKSPANYVPLTPISFLDRSAVVFADRISVIHGSVSYTWRQTRDRCVRLASALSQLGISTGDVVSVLAPNVPSMVELHFGVPMAGALLSTLNIRHDSALIAVLLRHSETKVLFADHQFLHIAQGACEILSKNGDKAPLLVLIQDPLARSVPAKEREKMMMEYEDVVAMGKSDFQVRRPKDECDAISLNYTSGTTSSPKGVVYSHRGAYLNSLASVLLLEMQSSTIFLWASPMFHCNGWNLIWGVAAVGGTNICMRNVTAKAIFDNISKHKVTHMGGAPTVLNMLINAPESEKKALPGKVCMLTAAAPPPPPVLYKMEELGFHIVHSYGLTETYGPGTVCTWKPEWGTLPREEQAKMKSRQGVKHVCLEDVDVKDPVTMKSVADDGVAIGEVVFKGNTVMNGYFKNREATEEAFKGGWFWSGDLGVKHPDGYIELKDRSKDIIISGGENISSIEVESVLFTHPCVLEAAVVARPDEHWGETACAFVKLKDGFKASAEELISYCRERLPHYMAPKSIVFADLPKTSTGKVQKVVLRTKAKALGSLSKKGGRSKL